MSATRPDIAIVNTGSSSVKATLFASDDRETASVSEPWSSADLAARGAQVERVLEKLGGARIVGHRLVHGGSAFCEPVRITPEVRVRLQDLVDLAPLHMALGLAAVDAAMRSHPHAEHVGVFDTAFHATMPDAATVYAIPEEWRHRYRLRRHGFHGLSVEWAVRRTREILRQVPKRMVVCHLGSGSSVTALVDGRSFDTTMGFTPLEGLPMSTRSGSVDPGLILYMQRHGGMDADHIEEALEHRSGLLGLSLRSSELREIRVAAAGGDPACRLAVAHFTHAVRRAIGAMTGVMGGVDALVFTGGIGEHDAELRAAVASAAGARVDRVVNDGSGDRLVSPPGAPVAVLVIRSREDRSILEALRRMPPGAGR